MKITGFIAIVLFSFLLLSVSHDYYYVKTAEERDSTVTAVIAVTGDLMCHSVQFNYARVTSDSFDFKPVYRYVKDILSSADFTFGNLETVLGGQEIDYSGYPFFNSPDEFVYALKDAGFDLLTTSNNHSLDQGEKGLRRTADVITKTGMGYNGTFISREDRDSIRIFNINGINISFLSYTYGTNGLPIPKGKDYLINLIDTVLIKQDITKAKKSSDIVIVHYHFGEEYKRQQSESQQSLVKKTAGYGADIIIGGHPHVIQPAEYITGNERTIDSVFVIYSMGNFISNQRKRYTDAGVILRLQIQKNITTDEVLLSGVSYIPTWVFRGNTADGKEFIILPDDGKSLKKVLIGKEDNTRMYQSFKDTREMLRIIE